MNYRIKAIEHGWAIEHKKIATKDSAANAETPARRVTSSGFRSITTATLRLQRRRCWSSQSKTVRGRERFGRSRAS